LFFGVLFVALGIRTNSMYALLAGTAGAWLKGNRAFLRGQRYFAGGVYIVLGLTTALTGARRGGASTVTPGWRSASTWAI
jgi:threonine/homoserine/homoserine lactone efflux protein